MKQILSSVTIVLLLSSEIAGAGGWISGGGGGELLKDGRNPWFLNNVTDINYCIQIDEKHFGTTREKAVAQINRAIKFWKTEFKEAILGEYKPLGKLQLASQNFHEVSCDQNPDLSFQFGVLSYSQKNLLKEPSRFAGIAIRTSYHSIDTHGSDYDMRGRGFIYLSPESGPLAYEAEGTIPNAWNVDKGKLLYLTLVHELGHVFGISHIGSYGELMSEGYPESLLAYGDSKEYPLSDDVKFFSLTTGSKQHCPVDLLLAKWQGFFGAPKEAKCFRFEFQHKPDNQFFGPSLLIVHVASSPETPETKIHEIMLSLSRFFPEYMSLIALPPGQKLFQKSEELLPGGNAIAGISLYEFGKNGTFHLKDGKSKRGISIRFKQGSQRFHMDGTGADLTILTLL